MKKKTNLQLKKINGEEMASLNQKLYNEFSIMELEERLETDPLLFNSLFSIGISTEDGNILRGNCGCNKIDTCPQLQCGCDGYTPPPPCSCNVINSLCPELTSIL
ncbi:MAG: hypothetical protein LBE13_10710 [Bacteroidales bacterium]|jgi:hypothetical protein|nr:hypothetical protein [Bacteroidales bacterium]